MKRIMDILLSLTALIVLSPLLIPIAIMLRFTGEGYIFYRQKRVGKAGRTFGLYKFATMLKDSPDLEGGLFTRENDPRVFPFGRFLRATKINEIPQLLNILLGDMSIIGPRPQVPAHFDVFPDHVKREIIKVRPGLSGIGSVFFHNEESMLAKYPDNEHEFYAQDIAPYKGELEVWYVRHQSTALDVKLIMLTICAVLLSKSQLHMRLLRDLPRPESPVLAEYLGVG